MSTIISTQFKLPGFIVSNGQVTGNPWLNPNYLLFVDANLAESDVNGGTTSDVIIGGYNSNLPQNAVVTGIEMQLIAKRGSLNSPAQTLTIYAVDNTSGTDDFYPYIAPVSLNETLTSYILGTQNYQFSSSFTADQINNMKFQLVANGDLYVDSFLLKVYYYIPDVVPDPEPVEGACETCNSPIQVQAMNLVQPFLVGESIFYLKKGCWAYPDGTPIALGDFGDCGGELPLVFDQGKPKGTTGNNQFEENAVFKTSEGNWEVLPSGIVKVDLGSVNNRGRQFHQPYEHVPELMSDHPANAEVIISNNALFEAQHLRRCQVDSVFSPPITVSDEGSELPETLHNMDFRGAGVVAANDITDPHKKIVTIPGAGGTTPPSRVGTGSYTSGDVEVDEFVFTIPFSGINRAALIQISTEQSVSVVSVTVGGIAAVQEVSQTSGVLRQEQWSAVNVPNGVQDVEVVLSAPAFVSAGGESFVGVDQSTPVVSTQAAVGTSNDVLEVLTTTEDNSLVVDGVVTALTPILYTPYPGQSQNWQRTANISVRQGASSYQPAGVAGDNVTMRWSITQNTDWVCTAVELKGITTATPPANPLEVQDEGTPVETDTRTMNFTGPGVTVTLTGPNEVEVNIPGLSVSAQVPIQFEDEGSNLGSSGTVDEVDFVGAGVTATRVGDKVTITIPGGTGGGISAENQNFLFISDQNIPSFAYQILKFSNKMFAFFGSNILQFGNDATTGSIVQETPGISFPLPGGYSSLAGKGICTSEDGTKLYTLTLATQAFGANPLWTLRTYNSSLALTATSTYLGTTSFVGGAFGFIPMFVYNDGSNDHVVMEATNNSTPPRFWTDWVISGAALTTPLATNLAITTHAVATYKFGNVYTQDGLAGVTSGDVEKRSYSALTFGAVSDTNSLLIPDWVYYSNQNNHHAGFEITSSTVIGRWRNTSITQTNVGVGVNPNVWASGVYNRYTF